MGWPAWDGDVHIAGKHVVTAGGLTLEFREDFLGYPHGAHAFFPEWALEIIMGPMLFLPLESPKEILWEARGAWKRGMARLKPWKRGMARLEPWEGGVAGTKQGKKGYSIRI